MVREKLLFIPWMLVNKVLVSWVLEDGWLLDKKYEMGMVKW